MNNPANELVGLRSKGFCLQSRLATLPDMVVRDFSIASTATASLLIRFTTLANTPVEEYVRVFKTYEGDELRTILSGVFQYGRIGNASNDMKEIVTRSREALTIIGQESKLNAERVKGWGISVPAERTEEK